MKFPLTAIVKAETGNVLEPEEYQKLLDKMGLTVSQSKLCQFLGVFGLGWLVSPTVLEIPKSSNRIYAEVTELGNCDIWEPTQTARLATYYAGSKEFVIVEHAVNALYSDE